MERATSSRGEGNWGSRRPPTGMRTPSLSRAGAAFAPIAAPVRPAGGRRHRSHSLTMSGTGFLSGRHGLAGASATAPNYGTIHRSISVPVYSSGVAAEYSKRGTRLLSVGEQSARLAERAKKTFFHGSFTSSHGAVFTVPNRAQQRATNVPSRGTSVMGRKSHPRSLSTTHRASGHRRAPLQLNLLPHASALKNTSQSMLLESSPSRAAPPQEVEVKRRSQSADSRLLHGCGSTCAALEARGREHSQGNGVSRGMHMAFPESSPDLLAVQTMREHSAQRSRRPPISPTTLARAARALRAFEEGKTTKLNSSFKNVTAVAVDGRLLPVPERTPLVLTKPEEPMRRVQISSVVDDDDTFDDSTEVSSDMMDEDMISWCAATMDLIYLGVPAAITICFTFCMSVIPLAFVGSQLGELELTGASVGYFITCILILYPMIGLTFAMDTLCSHEYGRDPLSPEMGLVLQRGILINLFFLIPLCSLLYVLDIILVPIYGESVSGVAMEFLVYSPLFILPDMLLIAFGKFLNNQMYPHIPMIGLTAGVLITPFLQYKLTPLGVRYTMMGMAITAWFQLFVIIVITLFKPETRMTLGTWRPRDALNWADVKEYMKLAIPSAVFVAAEASSFDMTVLLCAQFSEIDGAAWSAIMNSLFIFASFSGGLSASACANIGRCIGAHWPVSAKRFVTLSIFVAFLLGVIDSVVLVVFYDFLMSLFGTSGKTMTLALEVLFMLPFLHIADSVQFTFQGIFSGLGKNHLGAIILLTSLWGIGIPLSIILGHFLGYKMYGVCAGITVGLCLEAPVMVIVASMMDYQAICDNFVEDEDEETEEEEEDKMGSDEELDEEYVEEVLRRSGIPVSSSDFGSERGEHYKRLLPPKERRRRRKYVEVDEHPREGSSGDGDV